MNISKLCRSCMKEVCVNDSNKYDEGAVAMFTFCTMIEVTEEDLFPKQFCSDCTTLIKSSYDYIKRAIDTNEVFKTFITESKFKDLDSGVINEMSIQNDTSQIKDEIKSEECEDGADLKEQDCPKLTDLLATEDFQESLMHQSDQDSLDFDIKLNTKTNSTRNKSKPKVKTKSKIKQTLGLTTEKYKVSKHKQIKRKTSKRALIENKELGDNTEGVSNLTKYDIKIKTEIDETFTRKCKEPDSLSAKELNRDELGRYMCHICNKVFASGRNGKWLQKHLKQHSKRSFKLKVVVKGQKTIKELEPQDLESKQILTCNDCKKCFTSEAWYDKHIKKHNASNPLNYCPNCSKAFHTDSQLRYHMEVHCETPLNACPACHKTFRKRKHLAVHLVTHSAERPYTCDICKMSFKLKHTLISHIKLHEKIKSFLCYICGNSFTTANSLQEHMVVHSGARPYACDQCDYRCGFRSALRNHKQRHTTHKRFSCPHCAKEFFDSAGLNRHIRTHTGERPYICPSCPLGFVDGWKRKVHLMRVHQFSLEEIPRMTRDGRPFDQRSVLPVRIKS